MWYMKLSDRWQLDSQPNQKYRAAMYILNICIFISNIRTRRVDSSHKRGVLCKEGQHNLLLWTLVLKYVFIKLAFISWWIMKLGKHCSKLLSKINRAWGHGSVRANVRLLSLSYLFNYISNESWNLSLNQIYIQLISLSKQHWAVYLIYLFN